MSWSDFLLDLNSTTQLVRLKSPNRATNNIVSKISNCFITPWLGTLRIGVQAYLSSKNGKDSHGTLCRWLYKSMTADSVVIASLSPERHRCHILYRLQPIAYHVWHHVPHDSTCCIPSKHPNRSSARSSFDTARAWGYWKDQLTLIHKKQYYVKSPCVTVIGRVNCPSPLLSTPLLD